MTQRHPDPPIPQPEAWRRTGRTTAMFLRARVAASAPACETVLVVVLNDRVAGLLKGDTGPLIVVALGDARTVKGKSFSAVFVDHACWELEMWKTAAFLNEIRGRVVRGGNQ